MKKLVFTFMLFCFASLYNQPSAHASPILTQDILLEEVDGTFSQIGSVSINVADSFEWAAPTYETFDFLSIDLFGFQFMQSDDDFFFAQFDIDNLMAGLEFLTFDLFDQSGTLAFDGIYEGGFGFGFGSIFTTDGEILGAFNFTLGEARVAVPAPATLGLMLFALFGLMMRRRAV
ncbi:MAG: PEP-CTERM sorting domain-containing protein [Alkalimonas sp.]|nr:PEP-CTERM sorting domain-containing protein [Alkalimonas sp.]